MKRNRNRKTVRGNLRNPLLQRALIAFGDDYIRARDEALKDIDFKALRQAIERIKSDSTSNHDDLAQIFLGNAARNGALTYEAKNGYDAAEIIRGIATRHGARLGVKTKSMLSEEIHLNRQLADDFKIIETDLGEWLIQQTGERPSHMVMPAIHLDSTRCAEIFSAYKGVTVDADIPHMVAEARKILRRAFMEADLGITGCNFAVAESGSMVLLTNEGNGRLTTSLPRVHIMMLGYEKLIRSMSDLPPLLTALPRCATGQRATSYVTMISGPTDTYAGRDSSAIIQKELHVIVLDNGRRDMLNDPVYSPVGRCIRCASCLNVCPAFLAVGGHAYGRIYSGGIGTLLHHFLNRSISRGINYPDMCLFCGRCLEVCPAGIPIPDLIVRLRSETRSRRNPLVQAGIKRLLTRSRSPRRRRTDGPPAETTPGSPRGYIRKAMISRLPGPLGRWVKGRAVPVPARRRLSRLFPIFEQTIHRARGTVFLHSGCLVDRIYPRIGLDAIAVLNRLGFIVSAVSDTCCGAPAYTDGNQELLRDCACSGLKNLERSTFDWIVSLCPTGVDMIRSQWPIYGMEMEDMKPAVQRAVQGVSCFIDFVSRNMELPDGTGLTPAETKTGPTRRVIYHPSCHLRYRLQKTDIAETVFSRFEKITWLDRKSPDRCCGFAGGFALKYPDISIDLTRKRFLSLTRYRPDVIAVDCPGCLMALEGAAWASDSQVAVKHSATLLAEIVKAPMEQNTQDDEYDV